MSARAKSPRRTRRTARAARPHARDTAPLLIAGVGVVALNLRPAVVSVAPLLNEIRADTGMSAGVAGLLTTLPVLCFGVLAPLAPRLAGRFGAERTLAAALVLIAAGILLRTVPGYGPLFAGTLLAGGAIAMGNVLLPGVVKRDFPNRIGLLMGLFSTGVVGGATLAAGLTVPIGHATGFGWRATLALWALPALAGLAVWWPQAAAGQAHDPRPAPAPRRLYRDALAWQVSMFMGLQSMVYYAAAAWIPTVLTDHGLSSATAGWLLSLMNLAGMITTFTVPIVAGRRPSQQHLVLMTAVLFAAGLAGLLLAPRGGAPVWMLLFGLGQGSGLSLALTMIVLRSPDPGHAAELSGMAQTVGYLVAAIGPTGLGLLHDASHGWTLPLVVLIAVLVPLTAVGLAAARARFILAVRTRASGDRPASPRSRAAG